MGSLSIIIPTLDAEDRLPGCLDALAPARRRGLLGEVVVADGGSRDRTAEVARAQGARVVALAPGRGRQLAAGAAAARGDWLLFLHADTRLAPGWDTAVEAHLARPDSAARAAAFRLAYDEDTAPARRVAALANWRTRRLGLPYGDQGLLIARQLYDSVGGYPELPLMEDVALVRRLGRRRLTLLEATAVTSAERYRRQGWWTRPLRNLGVLSLYFLGVPPATLKRLYG